MKNQTAYLTEPGKFEIKDSAMPICGDEDVIVEMKHVGLCGSDLMFYLDPTIGGRLEVELPIVLGHECSGVIVEVGAKVRDLAVGDTVALEPGVPCCKCEFCLGGNYNLCPSVIFMAAPPWKTGALKRYVSHPQAFTFKLPEGMSTIEGAMIEPLSVGIHAVKRSGAEPGKSALIMGAGCIGLMTLLALKNRGVSNIVVVDLFDNRLEKAKELGAATVINAKEQDTIEECTKLTGGKGFDLIYEAAGSVFTTEQIPELIKRGGKAVMVGNVNGLPKLNLTKMNHLEADIISVFRYKNIFPSAIESVANGDIPVKKVASDFYSFDNVADAFHCADAQKQTALKVIVEF